MKLLVITQKVDIKDDNLGFFHCWLEKFSEKLDKLYVICLSEREHQLPNNVKIFSLGKERGFSKSRQFLRFQKFLFKILPKVDGVFVHMCPIYAIIAFPLAKIFRKKMILWYAHGAVGCKLKLAEKLVDTICTSSLAGCRLRSKKIKVLGQGIDVELFRPKENAVVVDNNFKILSAGRIAPVKDQETLIKAIDILINQKHIKGIKVKIIGGPLLNSEKQYFGRLRNLVKDRNLENYIEFLGGVTYRQMPKYYQNSDLFINTSYTGSLDKVVLEAMASGCLVLNCNEAYQEILSNKYLFKKKDPRDLAEKIIDLRGVEKDKNLREIVIKNHNLDNLIEKIIAQFL